MAEQVAGLIELEDRRRARAAQLRGLLLDALLVVGERRRAAMDDPDVIVGIHPDADRLSEHPVIGHRLRPERIHLEARRLHRGFALGRCRSLENPLGDAEYDQESEKTRSDDDRAVPRQLPHLQPRFRLAPPKRAAEAGVPIDDLIRLPRAA